MGTSLDEATHRLTALLRVILWGVALFVVGFAAVMIVGMDGSSASQGGRYYVAIVAILVLLALDRQQVRLLRRSLPWSIAPRPEERQYQRRSFVVLFVASVFLLGLAHYRTAGATADLVRLVAYAVALVAGPLAIALILKHVLRKPVERGIDRLFGPDDATPAAPRSWSFSFTLGTPPSPSAHASGTRPRIAADRAARYRDAWQRIESLAASDPAEAVRRAHRLILEVSAATGSAGAFVREERLEASNLADIASVVRSPVERMRAARTMERTIQAALAGRPATPAELARALAEYGRILEELLAGSAHA